MSDKIKQIKVKKKPDILYLTPTEGSYRNISQTELLYKVNLLHEQLAKTNKCLDSLHRLVVYNQTNSDDTDDFIVHYVEGSDSLLLEPTLKLRGDLNIDEPIPEELTADDPRKIGWLYRIVTSSPNLVVIPTLNYLTAGNGDFIYYNNKGHITRLQTVMTHNLSPTAHKELFDKKEDIANKIVYPYPSINEASDQKYPSAGYLKYLLYYKVDKSTEIAGLPLAEDITVADLINQIGLASDSTHGFLSKEDKALLDAVRIELANTDDYDLVVNRLREVIEVFNNYPEGTTIVNALSTKVDKIAGKQLSTYDFDDEFKNKLTTAYRVSQQTYGNPHSVQYFELLNKPTKINEMGITDVYTKQDIDNKLDVQTMLINKKEDKVYKLETITEDTINKDNYPSSKATVDYVAKEVQKHDISPTAHQDLRNLIDAKTAGMLVIRGVIEKEHPTQEELTDRIIELLQRNPSIGDTLRDTGNNEWYYNGTEWNNFGQTIIGLASSTSDGLLSKENYTKMQKIDNIDNIANQVNDIQNQIGSSASTNGAREYYVTGLNIINNDTHENITSFPYSAFAPYQWLRIKIRYVQSGANYISHSVLRPTSIEESAIIRIEVNDEPLYYLFICKQSDRVLFGLCDQEGNTQHNQDIGLIIWGVKENDWMASDIKMTIPPDHTEIKTVQEHLNNQHEFLTTHIENINNNSTSFEMKANKVNSFLNLGEQHYPTAKLVKNNLDVLEAQIDLKEDQINKKDVIDSDTTNNSMYPTTKAVSDFLKDEINKHETNNNSHSDIRNELSRLQNNITQIPKFKITKMNELPNLEEAEEATIYIVNNAEFIKLDNKWEQLGTFDAVMDNYYTKENIDTKFTNVNSQLTSVNTELSSKLPLAGGSLTGNLTVGGAALTTAGYVTGTWLRTTANTAAQNKQDKIAVLDQNGWLYSRTCDQIRNDIGAAGIGHGHTIDHIDGLRTALNSKLKYDNVNVSSNIFSPTEKTYPVLVGDTKNLTHAGYSNFCYLEQNKLFVGDKAVLTSDNGVIKDSYTGNLDSIKKTGMYSIGKNSSPSPFSSGTFTLIHTCSDTGYTQIAFETDKEKPRIAIRVKISKYSGNWKPWQYLTTMHLEDAGNTLVIEGL